MTYFNLLQLDNKVVRDIEARKLEKEKNRTEACKFDWAYFDGPREQGYGGYVYDGRWVKVAHRIIEHWNLKPGDRVLDIGCAKGFLVKDLSDALPGLEVIGVDISDYALKHAHPDAKEKLMKASCDELPFDPGAFDLALAINTIHNLDPDGCEKALREMERVSPGRGFVQVDAYRTPAERQIFEDWMLTARTYLMPDEWEAMFDRTGYRGDYYWTILESDGTTA